MHKAVVTNLDHSASHTSHLFCAYVIMSLNGYIYTKKNLRIVCISYPILLYILLFILRSHNQFFLLYIKFFLKKLKNKKALYLLTYSSFLVPCISRVKWGFYSGWVVVCMPFTRLLSGPWYPEYTHFIVAGLWSFCTTKTVVDKS